MKAKCNLTIIGLHHAQITIPKGSENKGRAFYCDVLKLIEIPRPESLQDRGGFWLHVGNHQVHVGTEEADVRKSTKAHLAYEVTNLSHWRSVLQKQGIEILTSVPISGFDRFEFRDPFGNRVELIQRLA